MVFTVFVVSFRKLFLFPPRREGGGKDRKPRWEEKYSWSWFFVPSCYATKRLSFHLSIRMLLEIPIAWLHRKESDAQTHQLKFSFEEGGESMGDTRSLRSLGKFPSNVTP